MLGAKETECGRLGVGFWVGVVTRGGENRKRAEGPTEKKIKNGQFFGQGAKFIARLTGPGESFFFGAGLGRGGRDAQLRGEQILGGLWGPTPRAGAEGGMVLGWGRRRGGIFVLYGAALEPNTSPTEKILLLFFCFLPPPFFFFCCVEGKKGSGEGVSRGSGEGTDDQRRRSGQRTLPSFLPDAKAPNFTEVLEVFAHRGDGKKSENLWAVFFTSGDDYSAGTGIGGPFFCASIHLVFKNRGTKNSGGSFSFR